jgi:hypothetical protein
MTQWCFDAAVRLRGNGQPAGSPRGLPAEHAAG